MAMEKNMKYECRVCGRKIEVTKTGDVYEEPVYCCGLEATECNLPATPTASAAVTVTKPKPSKKKAKKKAAKKVAQKKTAKKKAVTKKATKKKASKKKGTKKKAKKKATKRRR